MHVSRLIPLPQPPWTTKEKERKISSLNQRSIIESGHPLHKESRENRENGQKKSLSGKAQGIWKCCQSTGKTQGIWFAQVVNSLILKVKDISKFAAKNSPKKY